MRLPSYFIPKSQNNLHGVDHLNFNQTVTNWFLNLKNTRRFRKKIIVSENYQNIRIFPPILGNGTFILLYTKVPNHSARSDTLQYQPNSKILVPGTAKHWKPLKEINEIWKKCKNIRKLLTILRIGSSILPH